jgi:hypothetical protein
MFSTKKYIINSVSIGLHREPPKTYFSAPRQQIRIKNSMATCLHLLTLVEYILLHTQVRKKIQRRLGSEEDDRLQWSEYILPD